MMAASVLGEYIQQSGSSVAIRDPPANIRNTSLSVIFVPNQ